MDRSAQIGLALLGGAALLGGGYWYLTRQPRNGGTTATIPARPVAPPTVTGTITAPPAAPPATGTAPPVQQPKPVVPPSPATASESITSGWTRNLVARVTDVYSPVPVGWKASVAVDITNAGDQAQGPMVAAVIVSPADHTTQGSFPTLSVLPIDPSRTVNVTLQSAERISPLFAGQTLAVQIAVQDMVTGEAINLWVPFQVGPL